jgi:hypothetical protein
MTRIVLLLAGFVLLGAQAASAADGPPKLNVDTSCGAAGASGVNGRTHDACMDEENTARKTLSDKWGQFSAGQQTRCTGLVSMGGPPSYVELLTCLEMAEQAKKIPDRGLLRGPSSGAAPAATTGLKPKDE